MHALSLFAPRLTLTFERKSNTKEGKTEGQEVIVDRCERRSGEVARNIIWRGVKRSGGFVLRHAGDWRAVLERHEWENALPVTEQKSITLLPNASSSRTRVHRPVSRHFDFCLLKKKSIKLLQNALRVSNEESITLCLNASVLSPCFKILWLAEQDSIILLRNVAIFPVFLVILWLKRSVCSCARAHNSWHWRSAINLYNRQSYYRKCMHVLLGA